MAFLQSPILIAISATVLFIITQLPSLTANPPILEPSLAALLTGVEHCDVQIIHSGRDAFNFRHLPYLATVTFNIKKSFPLSAYIFNVFQVRFPRCRIILVLFRHWNGLNPFQWLALNQFLLNDEDKSNPRYIFKHYLTFGRGESTRLDNPIRTINKIDSIFPLVVSNGNISAVNSTDDSRKIYWKHFEYAGLVKTTSHGKLEICLVVKNFKFLSFP